MYPNFKVVPIGRVERPEIPVESGGFFDPARESVIDVERRWEPALTGLEEYSHLVVLFWFDHAERPESSPELRPAEGREGLPPVGLFAVRTPRRPNPIGMSVVRLHRRDGNRLHVTGLDAWNGTPVLDLKGYNHRDELRPEATQPAWLERLWAMHDAER
jgi:tRNA-Thr(GGU) m(6)t(6)A37 methyltransferase TsaA